jgi:hypothetical protein
MESNLNDYLGQPWRSVPERLADAGNVWQYDEETRVFYIDRPHAPIEYWIDEARCKTPAQCADWLAHMAPKNWVSDKILADLVRAFAARGLLR